MALVVLLKGINVGGHRAFRPSVLARELERLGVVNIGAAGTFVVRKSVGRRELREEIARRVPFGVDVIMCGGNELLRLASRDPFAAEAPSRDIVPFVSVMARKGTPPPPLPLSLPSEGDWGLKVLACHDRFVLGLYRRQMKAIGHLGRLEKVFGVPLATRNWNTVSAIVRALRA